MPSQALDDELISVIIPTYNRAELVTRAVRSVLAQTYPHYEIIVVDDGSTDETVVELRKIGESRLRIIQNSHARGGAGARNAGIEVSRGAFVAFLDSDDEWLPEKMRLQLQAVHRCPDCSWVYCGVNQVQGANVVSSNTPHACGNILTRLLSDNVVGSTSTVLVRRSAIVSIGGFDEAFPASQDHDCWVRLAQRFTVAVVPDPLVRVHVDEGRERITHDVLRRLDGRRRFAAKHAELMRAHGATHLYARDSARRLLRWAPRSEVRRFCLLAIRAKKTDWPSYALLAATWLPSGSLHTLANVSRRIKRFGGRP